MARRNSEHPEYGRDTFTLHEVACWLGMHPDTYLDFVEEGLLPGIKREDGKTIVIPRRAYERMLDEGRMPQQEEEVA